MDINPSQLQTAATVIFSGQAGGGANRIFPEINEMYTVRKLFHHRIQISYSLILILPIFSRSKANIFATKTLIQHSMRNIHPFSNPNISASSAMQDLHNHVHKTAKGENRFSTYLRCSALFTRVQGLYSSRSTPLNLY